MGSTQPASQPTWELLHFDLVIVGLGRLLGVAAACGAAGARGLLLLLGRGRVGRRAAQVGSSWVERVRAMGADTCSACLCTLKPGRRQGAGAGAGTA